MLKPIRTIILITLCSFHYSLIAANDRHIHINGEHLETANILLLDQVVGNKVGDGYYWLNMQTGEWGYENNNQVQGVISRIANQPNQQTQTQTQTQKESNLSPDTNRYNNWEGVDQNGSVVSGKVNGKNCTYVSVSGMTMKSCD
jgi:hypothetical protein